MYIIDVVKKNGKIRGIGMKNEDGNIAMIGEFSIEIKRKLLIFNESKITFKKVLLSSEQYDECRIVGELGSFEKVVVFDLLDDRFKQLFSEYYEKELLSLDLFWNRLKTFISDRSLSLLELSVIHELFRDGIAKENIVGFEIMKEKQRISFNLADGSGVETLMAIIHNSLDQAKRLTSRHGHKIVQALNSRMHHV